MEMKKKIKAYGNTAVIQLTKEDLEIHNLQIGNIVKVGIQKDERED